MDDATVGRNVPTADWADGDVGVVRRLLTDRYGEPGATVTRLADGHPIFLVRSSTSRARVVRVGRALDRYAATLSVLELVGYPASRVVPDRAGHLVTELEYQGQPREALVITYVDGVTTPFEPAALHGVGEALGRLHRLGHAAIAAAAEPQGGLPAVERAGMLPANELRFGLSCLRSVADVVSRADRPQWERLVDGCERNAGFGHGLSTAFLHGDAHPWNSVQSPSGSVTLIDWDSSGAGPAVIDLAFLAVSADTGALTGPLAAPDAARLEAVLAGYASQMTLTDADRDALEAAVAFRVLVAAAVGFANMVRQNRNPLAEPSIVWSLDRLEAAPAIAGRMRRHLGHQGTPYG